MFYKKRAREFSQNSADSRVYKLMQLQKYDKALDLLEKIIKEEDFKQEVSFEVKTNSNHSDLYRYYGECLVHTGKIGKGIVFLEKYAEQGFNTCREALEQVALPAMDKFIKQSDSIDQTIKQVLILENCNQDILQKALSFTLERAADLFKNKQYEDAAALYNRILSLAEANKCTDFENIIRAGDSNLKCENLNKAWKQYEQAKALACTYHQKCRVHKKLGDLLIKKEQNWHAILNYLAALQYIPSDRGAKTKIKRTLKKLGLEQYREKFFQLNSKHPDFEQLENSLFSLRTKLYAG